MAKPGQNQRIRMLEEFVCEAIPKAGSPPVGHKGGVNAEIHMRPELIHYASQPCAATDLRKFSTSELLELVRLNGSRLTNQELLAIHDIATERWSEDQTPFFKGAVELSREAMLAAVKKSA